MSTWLGFPNIYILHWYWLLVIIILITMSVVWGIKLCFQDNALGVFILYLSFGYLGVPISGLILGIALLYTVSRYIKEEYYKERGATYA